jgi:hypothetical protein
MEELDTPCHRLYKCPLARLPREEAVGPAFLASAIEAGPGSLKFEKGTLCHPCESRPRPLEDNTSIYLVDGVVSNEARSMQGNLCTDGAAYPHLCPDLSRAGWAVVQEGEGQANIVIYGPVWTPLL